MFLLTCCVGGCRRLTIIAEKLRVEAELCFPAERASQGLLGDGPMIEFLISALGAQYAAVSLRFHRYNAVVAATALMHLVGLPPCTRHS